MKYIFYNLVTVGISLHDIVDSCAPIQPKSSLVILVFFVVICCLHATSYAFKVHMLFQFPVLISPIKLSQNRQKGAQKGANIVQIGQKGGIQE